MHAASGLLSLTMELLAFASRQFAQNHGPLCRLHSLAFGSLFLFKKKNFLVSELSGRRKTPAQRSALDNIGFFNFL